MWLRSGRRDSARAEKLRRRALAAAMQLAYLFSSDKVPSFVTFSDLNLSETLVFRSSWRWGKRGSSEGRQK